MRGRYINIQLRLAAWAIAIWTLLAGCRHHMPPPAPQHRSVHIGYSRLFSKIQGTWLSYDYVLSLSRTMSPFRSAASMDGILSFTIDSTRLDRDTVHCLSWISGHEERGMWIAFDSAIAPGVYRMGVARTTDDENDQPIQGLENIAGIRLDSPFITIYTATSDSLRYVFYGHVPKYAPADYVLKQYTTGTLFRGSYFTKDSDIFLGSSRIRFDPDRVGRLSGSPVYDSFDINVDVLDQNDSADYMEFFDSRKRNESRSFSYFIHGNVLKIYPAVDTGAPCILYKTSPADTLTRP